MFLGILTHHTGAYLVAPCQTFIMEFFLQKTGFSCELFLQKRSIINVSEDPKFASAKERKQLSLYQA